LSFLNFSGIVKIFPVSSQLTAQPTDSPGPQILSISSMRHMMSPAEPGGWSPQLFRLKNLEQIEKMEEEMNDPIKSLI